MATPMLRSRIRNAAACDTCGVDGALIDVGNGIAPKKERNGRPAQQTKDEEGRSEGDTGWWGGGERRQDAMKAMLALGWKRGGGVGWGGAGGVV